MVLWVVLNGLALYAPFPLQRRLTLGLYFPLAALAIGGLRLATGRWRLAATLALCLGLPTNLLVLMAGLHGVRTHDPALYLTAGEAAGMQWLAAQTPPGAIILAAPETGLFIPARSGRRVVYGHPFETVDAAQKERAVLAFFGPDETQAGAEALIRSQGVSYVFVGPRELAPGGLLPVSGLRPVYQAQEVAIYALPDQIAKNSATGVLKPGRTSSRVRVSSLP